jgi:peptide/nickel transport system substrate-binding protein
MASRHRRISALVLLILVVASFLAACGTSSGGSGGTKYGGTITSVPSPKGPWVRNFNPYAGGALYGAQGYIFETLLFINRLDGTIKPWLADSYNFNTDGTVLTFKLHQGVKWTDGQPFTSDDVVFTLNMLHQYPAVDQGALWQAITSVANPDPNTVVVNFKQPSAPLLWYLAGQTWIVSKHQWSSVDPTTSTMDNPIGTGPFALKSFSPQLFVLEKNKSYWQPGKPYIDSVRFPAYTSNTTADLLLSSGNVDWTGLFTPNIQQTFVDRDPSHNHYWFPPANVIMLYVNTAKAPYNNVAVRQALSAAIDRDDISKTAESSYAPPASPTAIVLPGHKSFLDSQYANLSFGAPNPSKAAQLLEGAGFKKGSDGIYVGPDGKRLSFKIYTVTGWTDWTTACQIMAKNFKAVGIDATVNAVSFNDYYAALQQGTFDVAISWTNTGPTPYYLYQNTLNGANTAPVGQTAASNWERWNDAATNQALQQFAGTTDQAVQKQAINSLQKIMVEQLPTIPLFYGPSWYEYSTKNVVGWPDANNPYAHPSPYTAPDAAIVALNLHKP